MLLIWNLNKEQKFSFKGEGVSVSFRFLKKGDQAYIPEAAEDLVKKKMADAIQNKYVTIQGD